MNNTISFTIPIEFLHLNRVSKLLNEMAQDLAGEEINRPTTKDVQKTPTPFDDIQAYEQAHPAPPNATGIEIVSQTGLETVSEPLIASSNKVDLDNEGLPWDARIHSSGRTKLKSTGVWKKAKNIAGTPIVDEVEAELRTVMQIPTFVSPPEPVVDIPPTPAPPTTITFFEFMQKITSAVADENNYIDELAVTNACKENGIKNIAELNDHPELISVILTMLGL